jgi:hypothetical protein
MDDSILAKFALPDGYILPVGEGGKQAKPKTRKSKHFIPALPLGVVLGCVAGGYEVALPLILAIHRQLTMTGREWTPLNKAIWAAAGNPPEKKRAKILALLKEHPALIQIRPKKTTTSHYEVAYGKLWSADAQSEEKLL